MKNTHPIIKYATPSRYDKSPFNTICIVEDEQKSILPRYYVQTSKDTDIDANWVYIGDILTGAFINTIPDDMQRSVWVEDYIINTSNSD
jgi:hypothetical protein